MFRRQPGKPAWDARAALLVILAAVPVPALAEADGSAAVDLTALSLEDLMNVQVTSVGKRKQRIADAPAAIHVISQEDIRRSGMSSIPELLRLSPGVQVARVNGNEYAIGTRGFNGLYANKLLVLMDGRTLYTPLFAGVFWSEHDAVLADLDRIEVIRGPGATLWGANAVNGVINITSKLARDTQGGYLAGRLGTEESDGAVRYGGMIGDYTYYRVYAKYRHTDDQAPIEALDAHDDWESLRGGFRIDHHPGESDLLTLQGDWYDTNLSQTSRLHMLTPPGTTLQNFDYEDYGGNVIGRWTHRDGEDSEFSAQVYYDRIDRNEPFGPVKQDTFDLDFQHRFRLSDRQQIIWGAGYRLVSDSVEETDIIQFNHPDEDKQLISAFIQDTIALVPDRLHLMIGSKFELNDYTGLEIQPGARVLWTPDEHHSVWGAVSRATRTPNRAEDDGRVVVARFPTPTPGLGGSSELFPNPDLDSEELVAYELGYRFAPTNRLSLDVAAFINSYDGLIGSTPSGAPFVEGAPPRLVVPLSWVNGTSGETYGVETSVTAVLCDQWRVTGSHTFLRMALQSDFAPAAGDPFTPDERIEGASPRNQFQIRSYYDVTRDIEFNAGLFYVDNLEAADTPSYFRLDLSLVWRPTKDAEISVGVQNALDPRHPELAGFEAFDRPTEIERAVYVRGAWRF